MVRPRGKPSTGRHRLEMGLRQDKASRQVTFSKRRTGLFKKGSELSILCGARLAIVVFSEAGNVFAFGTPSVDAVLLRDAPVSGNGGGGAPAPAADGAAVDGEAWEEMCRATETTNKRVAAETARMHSIGDKVVQAQEGRRFWWEADVEALGEAELSEFARALERLRDNVRRRADKLLSAPPAAAGASASATAAIAPGAHRETSVNSWGY